MNNLTAFFIELLNRYKNKSPKFFQILSWVGMIAAIITMLPDWLKEIGISVPQPFNQLFTKMVAVAGITTFIISKMTVNRAPDGSVAGDKKALPFTAQNEVKPSINKK